MLRTLDPRHVGLVGADVTGARPAPHWFSRVKSSVSDNCTFIGKASNYSVVSLKYLNIQIIIITSNIRVKFTFPFQ